MLYFNFIFGSILIFLCLIFIHSLYKHRREQWKIKIEPRITLNYNIYIYHLRAKHSFKRAINNQVIKLMTQTHQIFDFLFRDFRPQVFPIYVVFLQSRGVTLLLLLLLISSFSSSSIFFFFFFFFFFLLLVILRICF